MQYIIFEIYLQSEFAIYVICYTFTINVAWCELDLVEINERTFTESSTHQPSIDLSNRDLMKTKYLFQIICLP